MKKTIVHLMIKSMPIILIALIAFSSCNKLIDATEEAKLIIDFNLVETTIDVILVDAATGHQIGREGDLSVNLTITGADRDAVMDITGIQPQNLTFSTQRGFAGLALVPNSQYAPNVLRPVTFNIVAQLEGYISTSQNVVITSTGRNLLQINMVAIDNPPTGVSIARESGIGNLVGGMIQSEIRVNAPGDIARVSIPSGTIMRDAAGNALSGSLNILVAHFDNTVEEAMAAFPGGLMTNVELLNGENQDGLFYSAGLVAIEITDASGRVATSFDDTSIELTSVVSPQTYNPETGGLVAAGDQIPVWSYDEDSGQWTEESMATIENVNGQLQINTQLTHLSYYNFDWFWGEFCYEGMSFLFEANTDICDCFNMTGTMRRQADNSFMQNVYFWVCDGEPIKNIYAPSGIPVFIEWDNNIYAGVQVDPSFETTYIENLCENTTVTIPLITTGVAEVLTVEMELYCASAPNIIIKPSFGVWFRKADGWNWRWASMVQGDAVVCDVVVGQDYAIGMYYNNEWFETTVTVSQDTYQLIDFELPDEVCSAVFGF
jgi:hypothetical protein